MRHPCGWDIKEMHHWSLRESREGDTRRYMRGHITGALEVNGGKNESRKHLGQNRGQLYVWSAEGKGSGKGWKSKKLRTKLHQK